MATSEDVMKLVQTVERLPTEDQEKIFRIVDLLSLVPIPVQDRTQRMLRELLERVPASKAECVAGMDDVIEYLECNVALAADYQGTFQHVGSALAAPRYKHS
jgi:hypothetical protein